MDDNSITQYVFEYCRELFTDDEFDAYRVCLWGRKLESFNNEVYKENVIKRLINAGQLKTSYPDNVLKLLNLGVENFERVTTQRIMNEHSWHPLFNYCPQCGKLARTPQAKQCRFCGHSWRNT